MSRLLIIGFLPLDFEWIVIIAVCLLLIGLIFEPTRKAIGLLLIILGILECLTCIGAIFGIPSIFIGGAFLFSGKKSPSVIIRSPPAIPLSSTSLTQKSDQIKLATKSELVSKKDVIIAECPLCKEKQSVPIEYDGRKIKCQACTSEFMVEKN
jgi:membrane-bound ClpP family serine protease